MRRKINLHELQGVTPTDVQATEVLALLRRMADMSERQMKMTQDDKPAMDKMHTAGLVKGNIVNAQDTRVAFWSVMIEKSPEGEIKGEVKALDEKVKKAVVETLAVYGNATGGEDQDIEGEDDLDLD